MCVGVPMRILEGDEISALCARADDTRRISMLLIGAQEPGTQVLVHIDTAIRVLDSQEARLIDNALRGLEAALRGENFDALFSDLIDREPQLPEHLR